MIREALEYLQTQADNRVKGKVVGLPERTNSYGIINEVGELDVFELPPVPRYHQVDSVTSLIKWLGDYGQGYDVWVSEHGVKAVETQKRRDVVTMPLTNTPEFDFVIDQDHTQYEQKNLITQLRVDLPDHDFVNAIRDLRWEIDSSQGHDKSSVGKALRSKASGVAAVPDQFVVNASVYRQIDDVYSFRVIVQADVANRKIILKSVGKDIAKAQAATLETIVARLSEVENNVYLGSPFGG